MKISIKNQLTLNLVCEEWIPEQSPELLSEKVREILFQRGYSHIFNFQDFKRIKNYVKGFHTKFKAERIAEYFIEETIEKSDLSDYTF